jgi:dTDP-glucose 4,6-dehydratase
MRVLLTGIGGFIGHHLAAHILAETDWEIIGLDRFSRVGTPHRLLDTDEYRRHPGRVRFVYHDLREPLLHEATRIGAVDYVLHLAASSHVDRSIDNPRAFALDNVVGTVNLLDFCREVAPRRIIYFSTDEVFGPAPPGVAYKEWDRYWSGNPYSASKAGAEEFCLAYHNTFKVPVVISHTMNVFGERQHPEKFIPLVVRRVLAGDEVVIHADPSRTKPGSRYYIHARDVAEAVLFLLEHGVPGDKYNVCGVEEIDNLHLAQTIADILGRPLCYDLVDFHSSRPGHDLRYALSGEKLAGLGFWPRRAFLENLRRTVDWFRHHAEWLHA